MKEWKIVTDSGANIRELAGLTSELDFELVPLMINVGTKAYIDDENLDVDAFNELLKETKEVTSSACPAPGIYAQAFQGAKNIICFTISSALSGSYNSAELGRDLALESDPDVNIYICDSRSAAGEMELLITKALEIIKSGANFDQVVQEIKAYQEKISVAFVLESVQNLVNNGRVNRIVGGMVGLLGIRLVGRCTPEGELSLAHKSRGERRALKTLLAEMEDQGYQGGRLFIDHNNNQRTAKKFIELIRNKYADMVYELLPTNGLCSYYAEDKGLIVGFEKNNQ